MIIPTNDADVNFQTSKFKGAACHVAAPSHDDMSIVWDKII